MVLYRFAQWEDGSKNPSRTVSVVSDVTLTAYYQEVTAPPPGPCFIATVVYRSPSAPELEVLRGFRGRCLPNQLIDVYYVVGPHLAQLIKGKKAIERYVREIFNLFVKLYMGVKE